MTVAGFIAGDTVHECKRENSAPGGVRATRQVRKDMSQLSFRALKPTDDGRTANIAGSTASEQPASGSDIAGFSKSPDVTGWRWEQGSGLVTLSLSAAATTADSAGPTHACFITQTPRIADCSRADWQDRGVAA